MDQNTIEKKLAVVTGASSGIGYEIAKQLAEKGYDLVIAASGSEISDVAREFQSLGTEVYPAQVDLAKFGGTEQLWEQVQSLGRPVDVLVLNAGVGVSGKFASDISLDEDLNLIGLNVTSVVHLAKQVIPQMVKRGEGRVLITSSIAALMPGPFYATYAASKAFLLSFAEALYQELHESGVTVTALMPGPTDTDFFRRAGMEDTKAAQGSKDDPKDVAKDGLEALFAGKDHVVAGSFSNQFNAWSTHFMSERLKARYQATMTEPQTPRH